MTTVAWDGYTLAADKMAVNNGLQRSVTKIKKIKDVLCCGSGSASQLAAMMSWVENGGEFPKDMNDVTFYTISYGVIKCYEGQQHPFIIEDKFFACGSGRDYAIAAMHLGRSAVEAVQIASIYDVYTGNGVDVLCLP